MDKEKFDALAQHIWTNTSRRSALGIVFGAVLLGVAPDALDAKNKHKNKRKNRRQRRRQRGHDRPCYTATECQPGQGKNNSGCDFESATSFHRLNVQGSNLSGANLARAQLSEANLQGVDLGDACLVGANLHGAIVDGSTNLNGAIFCRTLMPDGSLNDQDCGKGTACCPTPPPTCPQGEICEGEECTTTFQEICSVFGILYDNCCYPLVCTPHLSSPFLTFCNLPCSKDTTCEDHVGPTSRCVEDLINCPYLNGGKCCSKP